MMYCGDCHDWSCPYREFGGTCKRVTALPVSDTKIKVVNELMEEQVTVPAFWAKFRAEAAKDLFCAALSNSAIRINEDNAESQAKSCVLMADLLIKQLKGETE